MNDPAATIALIEARVRRRMRLRAAGDWVGLAIVCGAVALGGLVICNQFQSTRVLVTRLANAPVWVYLAALVLLVALVILFNKLRPNRGNSAVRATGSDPAFAIDRAFRLDDRVPTASAIVRRGGQLHSPFEAALIEDVAERLGRIDPAAVVRYRLPSLSDAAQCAGAWVLAAGVVVTLLLVSRFWVAASGQAVMVQPEEAAAIETAGTKLETASVEVEKSLKPGTETSGLAREQAELARSLRRSGSRAEALRKLSALAERIRTRHDQLAKTRADEVVDLAERRFEPALQPKRAAGPRKIQAGETSTEPQSHKPTESPKADKQEAGAEDRARVEGGSTVEQQKSARDQSQAPNDPRPAAGETAPNAAPDTSKSDPPVQGSTEKALSEPPAAGDSKVASPSPTEASTPQDRSGSKEAGKGDGDQAGPSLAGGLLGEAAKAAPGLSAQLLKKAAELRANKLSEAEIKQLAQAAKDLSRDLEKLASSKEFQQTVEQMARSIDPAQIEQVARELANQEDLRRELQAAAKLMVENRDARDTIAGFAQQAAEMRERIEQAGGLSDRGRETGRAGAGGSGSATDREGGRDLTRTGASDQTAQQPKSGVDSRDRNHADAVDVARRAGALRANEKEDKLYVKPSGGAVAARVPYSTAYPGYRREAERSVERSQVPARLRSVVRTYFDSINPDTQRTQGGKPDK